MRRKTIDFIKKNDMLHAGEQVVVGVSGGADSICLLHILWCIKAELSIELQAVHIHHGLRGNEADRDASFSASFCIHLGVPCDIVRIQADEEAVQQGISVEEAGREARYRIFREKASLWEQETGKKTKIAVAHHGDDSAETVLYHLFRGSGLKGLGGIPPVRENIMRPLLWASRKEILVYLEQEKLEFVSDSTNEENDYTRNKIRNEILPIVTGEINSQAVQNILRAANLAADTDAYLEKKAKEWLRENCKENENGIPAGALSLEEPVLQRYIVRGELKRLGSPLKDVAASHVEDILGLLMKHTGKGIDLPDGVRAEIAYGRLYLILEEPPQESGQEQLPKVGMRVFSVSDKRLYLEEIPQNQYTKWFDYDRIVDTLSVRFRKMGDYITLPGGKKKTVKAYMIDEKIPVDIRGSIPLLADGSHILWIIGYRISEYYKITEHTKNILEVHLDGGTEAWKTK